MKVYAFVGQSGSGKSHRVQWVAKELNIECIIDDGILIRGHKILAGTSAKKETSKIASIKRALFLDTFHADKVKEALKVYDPQSIIILGTSDDMVEKIRVTLELPEIYKIIRIGDVATPQEINQALTMRNEQGKHVIPVPTFEIKKQFSGYFLDPLKIFRAKEFVPFVADKSVVRPTFSYLGKYTISDYAIYTLVENVRRGVEGIDKILKFRVDNLVSGIVVNMDLAIKFGVNIQDKLLELQQQIKKDIEAYTGLNLISVNIVARTVYVDSEKK